MKKLRLTLNGKVYEVVVEVLEDDEQYVTGGNLPSARTAGTAPRVKTSAAAPAPAPAAAPARPANGGAPGTVDPNTILAPIAGTVQKVFVQAGTHVEEKTPVVLLDAMKMDTYIYAPRAMTITEVAVEVGASVQVGDPLVRFTARD